MVCTVETPLVAVMAASAIGVRLLAPLVLEAKQQDARQQRPNALPVTTETISADDDRFLEELERANVQFFLDQADSETGLVKDRCNVRGTDNTVVASIAATGFGLTALCIGHKRGYLSVGEAHLRVITTLHFLLEKMPRDRGFFYHFANLRTAERMWGI